MKKAIITLVLAATTVMAFTVQAAGSLTRLEAITSQGAAYDGPGDWTVNGERLVTASNCGTTCDAVTADIPLNGLFCFQPLGGMPVCDRLRSVGYGNTQKIVVTN